MKKHTFLFSTVAAVMLIGGCGKSSKESPPKADIEAAIKLALPAYLKLDSLDTESLPSGSDAVVIKIKAEIVAQEDLCVPSESQESDKLLRIITKSGAESNLYGSIKASRMMDKWTLLPFVPETRLDALGQPKVNFGAGKFIEGSDEAKADIQRTKEMNAKAEAELQAMAAKKKEAEIKEEAERKERLAKQTVEERAARAQQEIENQEAAKRQKEEQEMKQKAFDAATKPGAEYQGFLVFRDRNERQAIRMVVVERNGFMIKLRFSNPAIGGLERDFEGELLSTPRKMRDSDGALSYSIVVSPPSKLSWTQNVWRFWESEGWVALNLSDTGLVGECQLYENYTIKLQREGTKGSGHTSANDKSDSLTTEDGNRVLTEADLADWDAAKLRNAINMLYAKQGFVFESEAVSKQFKGQPWYRPNPNISMDQAEAKMTDVERQNLKMLGRLRDARK